MSEEKEESMRFNTGKVECRTAPMLAVMEMCKTSTIGGFKYADHNFRKDAPTSQYLDAMWRHYIKYMYGEDLDKDTMTYHLGSIAWNALVELEKILTGTRKDDRFVYPNIDEILEKTCNLNEEQMKVIEGFKK